MAYSDDVFLPDDVCEICGAQLSNEVVIQEFADGSIARLCSECAAGAALQVEGYEFEFPAAEEPLIHQAGQAGAFELPDIAALAAAAPPQWAADDRDAMEKTRELLTPVVDLIGLQQEMQGALQRLATSLETFASGVISEKKDRSLTVEERLAALERELDQTRARLQHAEARLAASGAVVAAATGAGQAVPTAEAIEVERPTKATEPEPATEATDSFDFESTFEATEDIDLTGSDEAATGVFTSDAWAEEAGEQASTEPEAAEAPVRPAETAEDTGAYTYAPADFASQSTPPPMPTPVAPPPVAPPEGPATAVHHNRPSFQLAEVQLAQKYFNDSQFTSRIRDVRKSLGKPRANLSKLIGAEPKAILTIAWDIIWYQYLIELRRDIPTDERVVLHRQGMDLDELTSVFKEKNSAVDDEGRLDASELEVKLLSDPSTLITEMSDEEERALEDATEEIWDQKTAPEFKWDA